MTISTKTLAILAIASAIGFTALVVLSEIYLSAGLGLLDGRLNGYDADAVTTYLGLLSEENRQFYIGPFRTLDTIVPPMLAATFAAMIWKLGNKLWRLTVIFPLIYVVADLRENALVGQILKAGNGNFDNAMAASASDMTQLKWLFTVLSLAAVLWLWRKGRAQK
jgi:hypothetical protein